MTLRKKDGLRGQCLFGSLSCSSNKLEFLDRGNIRCEIVERRFRKNEKNI